jgi:putative toxin-antitoxin system antitoxin component (TIGR02293 family)
LPDDVRFKEGYEMSQMEKTLTKPKSNKRVARLIERAARVLESGENARKWLTSPQIGLGGAVPMEYAGTEVGAREVEDLLGRIEHGVYS